MGSMVVGLSATPVTSTTTLMFGGAAATVDFTGATSNYPGGFQISAFAGSTITFVVNQVHWQSLSGPQMPSPPFSGPAQPHLNPNPQWPFWVGQPPAAEPIVGGVAPDSIDVSDSTSTSEIPLRNLTALWTFRTPRARPRTSRYRSPAPPRERRWSPTRPSTSENVVVNLAYALAVDVSDSTSASENPVPETTAS